MNFPILRKTFRVAGFRELLPSPVRSEYYRRILRVSLPLVGTTGTILIMEFTDRVFLARFSLDALAAAAPAGIAAFLFLSFFLGVAGYVGVFVAQYAGAGGEDRIGATVWQGLWFTLGAGFCLAPLGFAADAIFRIAGHPPAIREMEALYFRLLCSGGVLYVLANALSGFFTGLGRTRTVMAIHLLGMVVNIPVNYVLIFGKFGLPSMGIVGAGIATVLAWAVMSLAFVVRLFTAEHDRRYGIRRDWRFRAEDFRRLLRFGVPGALQFTLDVSGFAFCVFVVGRIGTEALALSTMVMSLNSIAFTPMMGISIGTSTLVGQALGAGRPEEATEVARHTLHVVLLYIVVMAVLYLGFPRPLLALFHPPGGDPAAFERLAETGTDLLRVVALYIFFDAQYMTYVGVLKGAGDTAFVMGSIGILSVVFMFAPLYVGVVLRGAGLMYVWICVAAYVFSLFCAVFWRYRRGTWKGMRVIEAEAVAG